MKFVLAALTKHYRTASNLVIFADQIAKSESEMQPDARFNSAHMYYSAEKEDQETGV